MVLTTETWTQTLSLHRGQISGLTKSELEQALAFEAEPFSGLAPLTSALGACDSGARDGSATFWVVQLARVERDGFFPTGSQADDLHVGLAVDDQAYTVSDDAMIIDAENANRLLRTFARHRLPCDAALAGMTSSTVVPLPGVLLTFRPPPNRAARSFILIRP